MIRNPFPSWVKSICLGNRSTEPNIRYVPILGSWSAYGLRMHECLPEASFLLYEVVKLDSCWCFTHARIWALYCSGMSRQPGFDPEEVQCRRIVTEVSPNFMLAGTYMETISRIIILTLGKISLSKFLVTICPGVIQNVRTVPFPPQPWYWVAETIDEILCMYCGSPSKSGEMMLGTFQY